jgi:osmotically inducible lipoprotein OsmB
MVVARLEDAMRRLIFPIPFLIALALSACGDTLPEQALIGAGTGAGAALALQSSIPAGALIGAGANVVFCNLEPEYCF